MSKNIHFFHCSIRCFICQGYGPTDTLPCGFLFLPGVFFNQKSRKGSFPKNRKTLDLQGFFCAAVFMLQRCLRTIKRCVKWGKNDQKYTNYALDKLEFVLLFSAYNNVCVIGFNYIYNRHCGFFDNQCYIIESIGIHLDFASSHINIFTLVFING